MLDPLICDKAKTLFGATQSAPDSDWSWADFAAYEAAKAFKAYASEAGFDTKWSIVHEQRILFREPIPRSIANPTPHANCQYGAPLGRNNRSHYEDSKGNRHDLTVNAHAAPFHMVRVRLDSGGYDSGGAYWGIGDRLYYYQGPITDIDGYVRGRTREAAKAAVRAIHPHARFFR